MENNLCAWVNKNYLIRYSFNSVPNKSYLISSFPYVSFVGETLANKHFTALKTFSGQRYTVRLRRGLKIDFVSK